MFPAAWSWNILSTRTFAFTLYRGIFNFGFLPRLWGYQHDQVQHLSFCQIKPWSFSLSAFVFKSCTLAWIVSSNVILTHLPWLIVIGMRWDSSGHLHLGHWRLTVGQARTQDILPPDFMFRECFDAFYSRQLQLPKGSFYFSVFWGGPFSKLTWEGRVGRLLV